MTSTTQQQPRRRGAPCKLPEHGRLVETRLRVPALVKERLSQPDGPAWARAVMLAAIEPGAWHVLTASGALVLVLVNMAQVERCQLQPGERIVNTATGETVKGGE